MPVEAPADERREHVPFDRDVRPGGRHAIEDLALKDVGAGVDRIGVDLLNTRFLDEFGD